MPSLVGMCAITWQLTKVRAWYMEFSMKIYALKWRFQWILETRALIAIEFWQGFRACVSIEGTET